MAPLPSATVPGEKAASSPVCEVVVILAACILLQFVLNYFGVNNLFSALAPGPYKNVFIGLVLVRVSLWLALPLVCLWWFSKSLNELKSEGDRGGVVRRRPKYGVVTASGVARTHPAGRPTEASRKSTRL